MSMWSPRCGGSLRASRMRRPRSSRRWRAMRGRSTRRSSRSRSPRRARTSLTRSLILWVSQRRVFVRRPRRLGRPCRKRTPRWRSPPRRSRKPAPRKRPQRLRWSRLSVRSRPRVLAHLLMRRLSLARSRRWPRRVKRRQQQIRRPTRRPRITRTLCARRRSRLIARRPQLRPWTSASQKRPPGGSASRPRSRAGSARQIASSARPARLIPRSALSGRG